MKRSVPLMRTIVRMMITVDGSLSPGACIATSVMNEIATRKKSISVNGSKKEVLGYLSGKMRMHYIRILEGDRVKIEMTPYDKTQGRIIYRMMKNES